MYSIYFYDEKLFKIIRVLVYKLYNQPKSIFFN